MKDFLHPFKLLQKRVVSHGLAGGSNAWLFLGALSWLGRLVRKIWNPGEPVVRYTGGVGEGDRIVIVHEPEGELTRRKRSKKERKAAGKAEKRAIKAEKKAARRARKA